MSADKFKTVSLDSMVDKIRTESNSRTIRRTCWRTKSTNLKN